MVASLKRTDSHQIWGPFSSRAPREIAQQICARLSSLWSRKTYRGISGVALEEDLTAASPHSLCLAGGEQLGDHRFLAKHSIQNRYCSELDGRMNRVCFSVDVDSRATRRGASVRHAKNHRSQSKFNHTDKRDVNESPKGLSAQAQAPHSSSCSSMRAA